MAKIPNFQQNQRIGQQGGQQVASASDAAAPGEAIVGLGKALQNVGTSISQYQKAKEKTDLSNAKYTAQYKAKLHEQDVVSSILSPKEGDPKPADDGSDMVQMVDQKYKDLYDQASTIKDGNQRQAVQMEYAQSHTRAREKILNASIAKHASYEIFQKGDEMNGRAVLVSKDPTAYEKELGEYRQSLIDSNVGDDNKIKMYRQAQKEFGIAAVQGTLHAGRFDAARDIVNSKIGDSLDFEQKEKLLKSIDREERSQKAQINSDAAQKRIENNQKKRDQKNSLFDSIFTELNGASGVEEKRGIKEKHKAALGPNYDKISTTPNNTTKQVSLPTYNKFLNRAAKNQNMGTYVDDILRASSGSNPSLSQEHAGLLMKEATAGNKTGKDNSYFLEQRNLAVKFIDEAYAVNSVQKKLGKEDVHTKARVSETAMKYWQNGEPPMVAAKKALYEIDPDNLANISKSSGRGSATNRKTIIEQNDKNIMKSYYEKKKAGRLTPAEEKSMLMYLSDRDARIKAEAKAGRADSIVTDDKIIKNVEFK